MKKKYLPAEVEIVVLKTEDVLKVSNPADLDNPGFDPENGGSAGWT